MKVLFAAGGTGGHLYPAFAIAQKLRARGDEIAFVGTRDRLEARLVPAEGYTFFPVSAHPLSRRLSFDVARTVAKNCIGMVQSLSLLSRFRPDVIVATGGYVCVPVVLAAHLRRVVLRDRTPVGLLEPNVVPGVANRLLARYADAVWDAATTGVPVRASLLQLPSRDDATARLGLDPQRKTLLAFGGSQGARSLNDALIALAANRALPNGWQLLHVTGERDYERVRRAQQAGVAVYAYLDDPADAFAAADMVLARAGASTLAEIAAVGVPAILVPYPHASEAHQHANADALAETGAAIVVDDAALGQRLGPILQEICGPERLASMRASAGRTRHDAAAAIVARIDTLVARREGSP
jgi:UDP-N-acetylglucosamine--N-acetylmuramyl-(pentapeptide) pyrophosphoryl-undecaprenol N-acetylglucosamine transferase